MCFIRLKFKYFCNLLWTWKTAKITYLFSVQIKIHNKLEIIVFQCFKNYGRNKNRCCWLASKLKNSKFTYSKLLNVYKIITSNIITVYKCLKPFLPIDRCSVKPGKVHINVQLFLKFLFLCLKLQILHNKVV